MGSSILRHFYPHRPYAALCCPAARVGEPKITTHGSSSSRMRSFPHVVLKSYAIGFKELVHLDGNSCMQSGRRKIVVAEATADSNLGDGREDRAEIAPSSNKIDRRWLQLGITFCSWYFHSVLYNIYHKKILNVFPFPWLLGVLQLLVGAVWMLGLWCFNLHPLPTLTRELLVALALPALFHMVGYIAASIAVFKVSVSFTHLVKSSEPVFSIIFSSFMGETYPPSVWLSLLPIMLGCSLAAISELSFNFTGLWAGMISNIGVVLRNFYSKRGLEHFKQIDGINLYGCMSILSLLYLFPIAVLLEGSKMISGYHQAIAAVGKPSKFFLWAFLSGIFNHLYNQSSYQTLDDISPLTFSVGNTMKRVIIIVTSVIVFRNRILPMNVLGFAIAIFGTFLYSQTTQNAKAEAQSN